jgi:hypothetical protein
MNFLNLQLKFKKTPFFWAYLGILELSINCGAIFYFILILSFFCSPEREKGISIFPHFIYPFPMSLWSSRMANGSAGICLLPIAQIPLAYYFRAFWLLFLCLPGCPKVPQSVDIMITLWMFVFICLVTWPYANVFYIFKYLVHISRH